MFDLHQAEEGVAAEEVFGEEWHPHHFPCHGEYLSQLALVDCGTGEGLFVCSFSPHRASPALGGQAYR